MYIGNHSDEELSLIVFNDEGLYNKRHTENFIEEYIDGDYTYSDEQKRVLIRDLIDDAKEIGDEKAEAIWTEQLI